MNNRIKTIILTMLTFFSVTSCATVMHGTRQSIGISSNPGNASIWVDRVYVGNTPLIVDMTRKDNHYVVIDLEGYQPYEAVFTRRLSGWVFGNIIFGGVIGLAVDAISGGIYTLTPDQVHVHMCSCYAGKTKNTSDSYIAIVLQPDPSWTKVGNLVALNSQ